jgi:hypothetical protein
VIGETFWHIAPQSLPDHGRSGQPTVLQAVSIVSRRANTSSRHSRAASWRCGLVPAVASHLDPGAALDAVHRLEERLDAEVAAVGPVRLLGKHHGRASPRMTAHVNHAGSVLLRHLRDTGAAI